jgi:hypothetical protein
MSLADFIPCPLCGQRDVIIMTCTECWPRVSGGKVSVEDRAKIALFERHAPMSDYLRQDFMSLKRRHIA